jgi:hypothetical protein
MLSLLKRLLMFVSGGFCKIKRHRLEDGILPCLMGVIQESITPRAIIGVSFL